jgi:ElaB/YqjD/DUF883 family membrane-anchored ribosome-binding protein
MKNLINKISRKTNELIEKGKNKTKDSVNSAKKKANSTVDSANDLLKTGKKKIVHKVEKVKHAVKT